MKIFIIILSIFSCFQLSAKDIILNANHDIQQQLTSINANYIITSNIDLYGRTVSIPAESTLIFKSGLISNGTIVGTMTKISCKEAVFKDIKIKGTWNLPTISTSMFFDATKPDVLKQVFALAHNNIKNTIYICPGNYLVSAPANTKGALYVPSNTTVEINGIITLKSNDFPGCAILYIKNANNIVIKGTGALVGDKNTHTGTNGEWGMGIQIMRGKNISIHNLDISNCWGDCIYIGDQSSNVDISNCKMHHARRQGVSITYASNVFINKCVIHDIAGTAPEYGIDFEPNANSSVHHMIVSGTEIYNCKGGIIAGIKGVTAENASVGDIIIDRCNIHNLRTDNTFRWHNCSNIKVVDCVIDKYLNNCAFKVDAKNVKYENIKMKE